MRLIRIRSFSAFAILCAGLGLLLVGPATAQVASSLLNEGDAYPAAGAGHAVSSLSNTAVNHAGGYAISLNSSDGATTISSIWGNGGGGAGANIRSEGTFGPYTQTSFESFYGLDNNGSVCYSASSTSGATTGLDGVWKDDTPVAVEEEVYPHAPALWWSFGSRPGISADGIPYFVGGVTTTQGGSTTNRGLFIGMTATPVFVGGDNLPGLPAPLDDASTVSFDYRYSAFASAYIGEVQLEGITSSANNAMVLAGAGLVLGGTLVQEGNTIPVVVGGDGTEAWDNFDYTGVTETGHYFFTGDTNGDTSTDEIILKDGFIIRREGDLIDGEVVSGSIEGAYMNEDGDLGYIWDIQGNSLEALFLNDQLLLTEGEEVDLDGNGTVDPGAVLANFTGTSALTLSDRDRGGAVNVYFTADIDTAGTTSTSDDVEGFFCMRVPMGPTAIVLSGLHARADSRSPGVTVEWSTSSEVDHDGFHVYRSNSVEGGYERLTNDLVRGSSPYIYRDARVQPNSTYYYKVGAVDFSSVEVLYGPVAASTPDWGMRTRLALARPNPFQRNTEIRFTLANDSPTRLTIFDVTGRQVAMLVDEPLVAGDHTYAWNGRSSLDQVVGSGVYFYRLETNGFTQTRKLVRLGSN